MKQSAPLTLLLLLAFGSWPSVGAASPPFRRGGGGGCSSSSLPSSSSLMIRSRPRYWSRRHSVGTFGNATRTASHDNDIDNGACVTGTCTSTSSSEGKAALVVPRGGGGILQDPAVRNDIFGTPNTLVPPAYPLLDAIFVVGYSAIIVAMPGSASSLHKLIHIVWAGLHVILVAITNYGVDAFFPNKPTLPLKLMWTYDASWAVFVFLMPFLLDQGSDGWNLFWHITGAASAASIPFLDYKADVRKGSESK